MSKSYPEGVLTLLRGIVQRLENGCGAHACRVKKPEGMGTNGPCRCTPRTVARDLRGLAESIESRKIELEKEMQKREDLPRE